MTFTLDGSVRHPKIYAYTIPEYAETEWEGGRNGKGLLKVGDTTGDVHARIKAQLQGVNMPSDREYDLAVSLPAVTDDGRVFRDHEVHKALVDAGVTRIEAEGRTEWFECTREEVEAAVRAVAENDGQLDDLRVRKNFKPRPEQEDAVRMTSEYFRSQPNDGPAPQFLWNAKMRFGKNFTTYQLVKEMGWNRVLVLTYKPAVEQGWREDLLHQDFEGWRFKGKDDRDPDPDDPTPLIWFSSFQDALGTDENGQPKVRNELIHLIEWDCVVVDEYHFGGWREAARSLYMKDEETGLRGDSSEESVVESGDLEDEFKETLEQEYPLTVGHYLYLSGTPFRALTEGEFLENQIFNWTYSDEQRAKKDWDGPPEQNPYASLPEMRLLVYEMPDELRKEALNSQAEFSLTEFFRTETGDGNRPRFTHERHVQRWLNLIQGQDIQSLWAHVSVKDAPPLPFDDRRLLVALQHTAWYLPSVNACKAMKDLLEEPHNTFFREFEIKVAAGAPAGQGQAALRPVERAIGNRPQETKSITLTCGKLMTGVTVPAWGGIFMLRELKSPESYFQAAFRVQSPWTGKYLDTEEGGEKEHIFKEACYVIDFAPNRALSLIAEYGYRLRAASVAERDDEKAIDEFMQFLPVLSFSGYSMSRLSAADVIDYLTRGTTASMLARRWNSPELLSLDVASLENILADEDLVASLERVETFRNIRQDAEAIIKKTNELKPKKTAREPLSEEEKEKDRAVKKERNDLKKKLQRFLARIPAFMYLTDNREKTIPDLITEVEPDLFQQVTQLTVDDFRRLVEARVFNDAKMNDAVWKFRDFEGPSLTYDEEAAAPAQIEGLWSVQTDRRLGELISAGVLEPDDEITGHDGQIGVITADYGISVDGIRYPTPNEAAIAAGAPEDVDGWSFWGLEALQESEITA